MNNQDVEQMIIDNQKLVHFVVNKYFPSFYDDEDIIQVGRIGLWKACVGYDSQKGKFSSFAVHCITNEIRMEFRRRERMSRFGYITSLDEPLYFDKDGTAVTLAHTIADPKDDYNIIDYDLSFLKHKLSKRDIEAFKMSICGYTSTEIGNAFGFTRTWASGVIKKAQKLSRKEFSYT